MLKVKVNKEPVFGIAIGYDSFERPSKSIKEKTFMLLLLCWVIEFKVSVVYQPKAKTP